MDNKYIARPCKNCKVIDCVFKGHENDFEVCEDYTVTNGDMIKAMFPKAWGSDYIDIFNKFTLYIDDDHELEVDIDWWNAPYKKEVEE